MPTKRARKSSRPTRRVTPEGAVLRGLLDLLAAKRILAFRMNTGAVKYGDRFVKFGVVGMADILAFVHKPNIYGPLAGPMPVWIEAKAGTGKQTHEQRVFERVVKADGQQYVVCRDSRELEEFLERL